MTHSITNATVISLSKEYITVIVNYLVEIITLYSCS